MLTLAKPFGGDASCQPVHLGSNDASFARLVVKKRDDLKSPAFQFYPADYLADAKVQLMTLEEEGAYIRLLCYCWREGHLPSDDVSLSRLAKGLPASRMTRVKACFVIEKNHPEFLVHPRLVEEKSKQDAYRAQWRKRQKNHRDRQESSHANVTRESRPSSVFSLQSSSSSSNTHTDAEKYSRAQFELFKAIYPESAWLDDDAVFRAWLQLSVIDQTKAAESVALWKKSDRWQEKRYIPAPLKFVTRRDWEHAPKEKTKEPNAYERAQELERKYGNAPRAS
jgi:uncharacterized protein YdaU (DUF1376 family)